MKVISLSNHSVSDTQKDRFSTSGVRSVCKYKVVFEDTGELFLPQNTSVFVEEEGSIVSKHIQDCVDNENVLVEYYTVKRQMVPIFTAKPLGNSKAAPRGSRTIKRGLAKDKVISIEKLEGLHPANTLAAGEYLVVEKNIESVKIFSSSYVFIEDLKK